MMNDRIAQFQAAKARGERLAVLTAYDYPQARLLEESGVDALLVGDSLGMVVLGYPDTTLVTMEEMVHHTRAVARGSKDGGGRSCRSGAPRLRNRRYAMRRA
jgi:3-methyl-2-oxobutanoate hydroxymethyltransferase